MSTDKIFNSIQNDPMVCQLVETLERQVHIIALMGMRERWIAALSLLKAVQILTGFLLAHHVDRRDKTLL